MRSAKHRKETGNRIREARKGLNMSQLDLSQAAMIQQQRLSTIETGESEPTNEQLINLSEALGVTIDFILKGKIDNSPQIIQAKSLAQTLNDLLKKI